MTLPAAFLEGDMRIADDFKSINEIMNRRKREDEYGKVQESVLIPTTPVPMPPPNKPPITCKMCKGNGFHDMIMPSGPPKRVVCGPCQGRGYIP